MGFKVPDQLLGCLDEIVRDLKQTTKVKGYKYFIGKVQGAQAIDYDDSLWNYSEQPVPFRRNQDQVWVRFDVEIPKSIQGISVPNSAVRISSFFSAPMEIYVDGVLKFSEKTYMDFKNPEIYLTKSALPGQTFKVACKLEPSGGSFYDWTFSMDAIIEDVEDAEFEINSFKEELIYLCNFKKVHPILNDIFETFTVFLEPGQEVPSLIEKIRISRDKLKPMEKEIKEHTVHMIGHAHIDMNWFWSMDETVDVIRRDFGTMIEIMENTPEFCFSQSQCATYEIAEKNFPEIFNKMKHFIATGNWDVTATTWVEGDINMASGESIVRHILYSKKYLKEKFGIDSKVMWCPDTFGHSANIPQIIKKGGIDYYFFMRCGKDNADDTSDEKFYNQRITDQPFFWWEGLDGTKVLAFNGAYNSDVNATNALDISGYFTKQLGLKNSMYVYGTGDHGGGPTKRDIKRAKQMDSYPTTPRIKFSTTHHFFQEVLNEEPMNIPLRKGEMNFVFDGCYTTHGDIKRFNRLCENEIVNTEMVATAAKIHGLTYKSEVLENCWKTTLFNQFHDIFDGSGIKTTYEYSAEIAQEALRAADSIVKESMVHIASNIIAKKDSIPVLIFNPTTWKRCECIKVQKPKAGTNYAAYDSNNEMLELQETEDYLMIDVPEIPPIGYAVIYLKEEKCLSEYEPIKTTSEFYEISTRYYWLQIKKASGEIITLFDKINKRYIVRAQKSSWRLKNGVLNTLKVYNEVSIPMSSWTIAPASSVISLISGAVSEIKEDGKLVKIISFKHTYENSIISQDIKIYNNHPRIDFETHVDWKQSGGPEKSAPMLKACFIPDVDNQSAFYEIPFGAVERPCKDIEVPALKWIDISDENYGVSILNDCKYGHKVTGNVMEITLIRSGWEPDLTSDIGEHDFTYSILPHKGKWKEADTIKESCFLNKPVMLTTFEANPSGDKPERFSFVELDSSNVVISAFKPSEDNNAYIIRLYEACGVDCSVKMKLGFDFTYIEEVDFNENKVYKLYKEDEVGFGFDIKGFEVKTFKIYHQ